jgi:hypothetical protein
MQNAWKVAELKWFENANDPPDMLFFHLHLPTHLTSAYKIRIFFKEELTFELVDSENKRIESGEVLNSHELRFLKANLNKIQTRIKGG